MIEFFKETLFTGQFHFVLVHLHQVPRGITGFDHSFLFCQSATVGVLDYRLATLGCERFEIGLVESFLCGAAKADSCQVARLGEGAGCTQYEGNC
ncbi:hypothetical protein D3C87_2010470 [compost metagenome]